MGNGNLLRHQLINGLTAQHTENIADVAINLWEKLATEIISIVGEEGFDSLFARSLFLAQTTFPWLTTSQSSPQADHRFTELKSSLAEQTPVEASEATSLLLITFTDILASLIGEILTTSILRSAWGDDVPDKAGKEFNNE